MSVQKVQEGNEIAVSSLINLFRWARFVFPDCNSCSWLDFRLSKRTVSFSCTTTACSRCWSSPRARICLSFRQLWCRVCIGRAGMLLDVCGSAVFFKAAMSHARLWRVAFSMGSFAHKSPCQGCKCLVCFTAVTREVDRIILLAMLFEEANDVDWQRSIDSGSPGMALLASSIEGFVSCFTDILGKLCLNSSGVMYEIS